MSDAHGHACYADRAWSGSATVVENERLACDTYRLRFTCPPVARQTLPGQFLMLRLAGRNDPLLGRPLAVYDVLCGEDGQARQLDIVYVAIGRMTRRLAQLEPGAPLEVWGPLGNGFPLDPAEHLVLVAGGIGQTPFLMLAKERLGGTAYGDPPRVAPRVQRVSLCYGARSAAYFAGVDAFRDAGVSLHLSTNDGSRGHHGLVTDLVPGVIAAAGMPARIVACGPEPMLKATAELAVRLNTPCQASLESPMACGIGICFSCVAKVRDADGNWDYRRTCVEGPVFDAERIVFD